MRPRLLSGLILTVLLAAPLAAQTPAYPDSVALENATRALASQLRCPVCQSLSINDSPSELAQSMRAVVRDMLAEGRSAEEIKAHFVSSYGEWVLLQPKASGFNLTVYILPILAVLAGAGLLFVMARRWTRPAASPTTVAAEDPDLAAWDELVPRS